MYISDDLHSDQHSYMCVGPTRTSSFIAIVFTVLVVAPLVVFIGALVQLRAFKLTKFPHVSTDPTNFMVAVALQVGIGCMLAVFPVYWVGLTLFQALGCLAVIGVFNIAVGHRALSYLVEQRGSKNKRE